MGKIIKKIVKTCLDCPYCSYDPYYNRVRDSGYYCKKAGRRIISDWNWDNPNNPNRLCEKVDTIPIPDWCPLGDYNEKT